MEFAEGTGFRAKLGSMSRADSQHDTEVNSPLLSSDPELAFRVLRGKQRILQMHAVLIELSARCEQTGAMDHIELFLDSPMNQNKIPSLVLVTAGRGEPSDFGVDELLGAAVVYEYEAFGLPTRVFVTDDGSGSRTVIAAPQQRSTLTIRVCEHLMKEGAQAALLSYKEEVSPQPQDNAIARIVRREGTLWGSQVRDMSTYLRIQSTFDQTLAQLGRHTRRNLRYYRRRAEVEVGCQFVPEVRTEITKKDFRELDRSSTHPVGERAMDRRYDDLSRFKDSFCVGIRDKDGRWLGLMGGRRHHRWTEVDWQFNRAGLERLSLGTAMRSYFLEDEVALGTERLYFEGGTPHTMRHSLETEKAVDIIAVRRSWRMRLMSSYARSRFGKKNFLMQTLADRSIRWQEL